MIRVEALQSGGDGLCVWQSHGGPPSGVGIVYLHRRSLADDSAAATRRLFDRLAAQGHVIVEVTHRASDLWSAAAAGVRRSAVAWLEEHAQELGVEPQLIMVWTGLDRSPPGAGRVSARPGHKA